MKTIKVDIIPLAICSLIMFIGFGICLTSSAAFGYRQYVATLCLIVACTLYVRNKRVYFPFFAIVLTLGVFGFIDFYYKTYQVGFGEFGINPLYIGLLIVFFAFSKNQIDSLSIAKNSTETRTLNENLIKSFELKFKDKTVTELRGIMDKDSKFTDEAKEAAKRVLQMQNTLD